MLSVGSSMGIWHGSFDLSGLFYLRYASYTSVYSPPNTTPWPVSDVYDWRVYLGLCAVPLAMELLIFPVSAMHNSKKKYSTPSHLCFVQLVPESARYYVSHGKYEKGMKVMQRVAWWNRRTLPKVTAFFFENAQSNI